MPKPVPLQRQRSGRRMRPSIVTVSAGAEMPASTNAFAEANRQAGAQLATAKRDDDAPTTLRLISAEASTLAAVSVPDKSSIRQSLQMSLRQLPPPSQQQQQQQPQSVDADQLSQAAEQPTRQRTQSWPSPTVASLFSPSSSPLTLDSRSPPATPSPTSSPVCAVVNVYSGAMRRIDMPASIGSMQQAAEGSGGNSIEGGDGGKAIAAAIQRASSSVVRPTATAVAMDAAHCVRAAGAVPDTASIPAPATVQAVSSVASAATAARHEIAAHWVRRLQSDEEKRPGGKELVYLMNLVVKTTIWNAVEAVRQAIKAAKATANTVEQARAPAAEKQPAVWCTTDDAKHAVRVAVALHASARAPAAVLLLATPKAARYDVGAACRNVVLQCTRKAAELAAATTIFTEVSRSGLQEEALRSALDSVTVSTSEGTGTLADAAHSGSSSLLEMNEYE